MSSLKLCAAALALAAACSCGSGGVPGGREWSRVYTNSFDRVWAAALAGLEGAGYYVEDRDRRGGRIVARSQAERAWEEATLDIRIVDHEENVRVDVQAAAGAAGGDGPGYQRLDRAVRAFLDDLDSKLD